MKGILAVALSLALAPACAWPAMAQEDASARPAAVAPAPAQPPLRSAAALEAYLEANAGKPTPLDALSPLARKRFLESLRFGPEGADPYDYERHDLVRELVADQIRALLALFGIEPDAYLLSLARPKPKPASQAQAEAQPSAIALAYDEFRRRMAEADARRFSRNGDRLSELAYQSAIERAFESAFGALPAPDALSDGDLELVHQAVGMTAFYGENPRLARLQVELSDELASRGLARDDDIEDAYLSLLKAKLFDVANDFARAHPPALAQPLPRLIDFDPATDAGPSVWAVPTDERVLRRKSLALDEGIQIVAIVGLGCHFSQDAMFAIRTDPRLKRALATRVTWLNAPLGWTDFDEIQAWNREHPDQPMVIAYSKQDWPMFRHWGTPTFHFFRNGKWLREVVGWNGEQGRRQLLAELDKLGLLAAEPDPTVP